MYIYVTVSVAARFLHIAFVSYDLKGCRRKILHEKYI